MLWTIELLVTLNNEFTISIPRLKCRHFEVAEVEVVKEEIEVMRLQGIHEEDEVEEDNQSRKLEDKDPKKSNWTPGEEDYETKNWLLWSTNKSSVD